MKKRKKLIGCIFIVVIVFAAFIIYKCNGIKKQKENQDGSIPKVAEIDDEEEEKIESVFEGMSSSKSEDGIKYEIGDAKKVYILTDSAWFKDDTIDNFQSVVTDEVEYVVPSEDKTRYYILSENENGELEWMGTATPSEENNVSFANISTEQIEDAINENAGGGMDYIITYSNNLDCIFIWVKEKDMIIPFCDEDFGNGLLSEKAYSYEELIGVLNKVFE